LKRWGLGLGGMLLWTLGCGGGGAWWREGELGTLVCATETRALYEHALVSLDSGETVAALPSQVVVGSADCARFATIDAEKSALRVVERATDDGRTLRQASFPYAGDREIYAEGMLLGDDVVLVSSREAHRLDLSTGRARWSWREPRQERSIRRSDGLTMEIPAGDGFLGRYWVGGCDSRPLVEHHIDMESLCVIDLKTGERTEHKGYTAHETVALGRSLVVVLEPRQIRAVEVGPRGLRERWVVPLDPQPDSLISATLQRDGDQLLVGTSAGVQVLDLAGRTRARLALHESDEVALSGDWLVHQRGVFDLVAHDLSTGEEHRLARLSSCDARYKEGLCGNFMFELDVVGPYAVVATRERSAAFPLPRP
jgi:hypothetical protein